MKKKLLFLPIVVFLLGILVLSPLPASAHEISAHSHLVQPATLDGYTQVFPHPGSFKQFHDTIFSLANNRFVAAELGYIGGDYAMLRARTDPISIGSWEQFDWYAGPNGTWLIQSSANGLFVAAELGYTGGDWAMLRARTDGSHLGQWEQFLVLTLNGCDPVVSNCQAIILSLADASYVAAELDYTFGSYAMLRARTNTSPGPWEQFDI